MGIGSVFGQLRLVRGGTRGHSSYHGIAPARPSLASLLMSSALALALNSFKVATTQAHASVLAPGQQPGAQALQDFSTPPTVPLLAHSPYSLSTQSTFGSLLLPCPGAPRLLSPSSLLMHGSLDT